MAISIVKCIVIIVTNQSGYEPLNLDNESFVNSYLQF